MFIFKYLCVKFFQKLSFEAIHGSFPEVQSPSGEFGHEDPQPELIGEKNTAVIGQQAIDPDIETVDPGHGMIFFSWNNAKIRIRSMASRFLFPVFSGFHGTGDMPFPGRTGEFLDPEPGMAERSSYRTLGRIGDQDPAMVQGPEDLLKDLLCPHFRLDFRAESIEKNKIGRAFRQGNLPDRTFYLDEME